MALLISGLLLWSIVHFLPSVGRPIRASLINRLGDKAYPGVFSLLIILSLLFIVFGWRSISPTYLYSLPVESKPFSLVLMVVAIVFFGASNFPTRIKRLVRHPQLTGVLLWCSAHLLLNGDSRSVILFGGLGIWSLLEMIFINQREGQWIKPEAPSWGQELKGLTISLAMLIAMIFAHPYIAGVAIQ